MGAKRSLVSVDLTHLGEPLDLGPLTTQLATFGHKLEEKQKALPSLEVPFLLRETDFKRMVTVADELRANSDVLIVAASGGCALAARAMLEAFAPVMGWQIPRLIFLGDHLSTDVLEEFANTVGRAKLSAIVCSYGDPSIELAVTQRVIADVIRRRHGLAESQRRIVLVSGEDSRALHELAKLEGHRHLKLPLRAKGQYLALTAATLLPLATIGVDPTAVLEGARSLARSMDKQPIEDNDCFQFAAAREVLWGDGKCECLTLPDPRLHWLGEWWRYVCGPSSQALAPHAAFANSWTTHQRLYLNGPAPEGVDRHQFEVSVEFAQLSEEPELGGPDSNYDGLADCKGSKIRTLEESYRRVLAERCVRAKHPLIRLELPRMDAFSIGSLMCFFETVAAVNQRLAEIPGWDDLKQAVSAEQILDQVSKT